jgi:hypothetical protein
MSESLLRDASERRGLVASGPLAFGATDPGVLAYRTDAQTVRMRITIADMTGGVYADFELPQDVFRTLIAALLASLEEKHVPRAP